LKIFKISHPQTEPDRLVALLFASVLIISWVSRGDGGADDPPIHPSEQSPLAGDPGFHPSEQRPLAGDPGFHPSEQRPLAGDPGFHPSEQRPLAGDPGLTMRPSMNGRPTPGELAQKHCRQFDRQ
jgi:hypothetical protein